MNDNDRQAEIEAYCGIGGPWVRVIDGCTFTFQEPPHDIVNQRWLIARIRAIEAQAEASETLMEKQDATLRQCYQRMKEYEAQAALYKKGVLDLALEIGGCSCGPEYTGRGLIAPDCAWHQASTPEILEEVGLRGEYESLIDAALEAREGE